GFERHGREVIARYARLLVTKEVVEHFPTAFRGNAAWQLPEFLEFRKDVGEDEGLCLDLGFDSRVQLLSLLQVGRRGRPGKGGAEAHSVNLEVKLDSAQALRSDSPHD